MKNKPVIVNNDRFKILIMIIIKLFYNDKNVLTIVSKNLVNTGFIKKIINIEIHIKNLISSSTII